MRDSVSLTLLPVLETLFHLLGCLVQPLYECFGVVLLYFFVMFGFYLLGACFVLKKKWKVVWISGEGIVRGSGRRGEGGIEIGMYSMRGELFSIKNMTETNL